jgi:hypothetical protein
MLAADFAERELLSSKMVALAQKKVALEQYGIRLDWSKLTDL